MYRCDKFHNQSTIHPRQASCCGIPGTAIAFPGTLGFKDISDNSAKSPLCKLFYPFARIRRGAAGRIVLVAHGLEGYSGLYGLWLQIVEIAPCTPSPMKWAKGRSACTYCYSLELAVLHIVTKLLLNL